MEPSQALGSATFVDQRRDLRCRIATEQVTFPVSHGRTIFCLLGTLADAHCIGDATGRSRLTRGTWDAHALAAAQMLREPCIQHAAGANEERSINVSCEPCIEWSSGSATFR
jgi:hypothetical protein